MFFPCFFLCLAAVAIIAVVWDDIINFISGVFASLFCMDVLERPYNDRYFRVILSSLGTKRPAFSKKMLLKKSDGVLDYFKKCKQHGKIISQRR